MHAANSTYRFAVSEDTALILSFIKELAAYEQVLDKVVATEELLHEGLFVKKTAEVIFAEKSGDPVGFALFFHSFSTILGRTGLYLEDLYVREAFRGQGLGKGLLQELARVAVERQYGCVEWWCLDWNTPSINFYLAMGAEPMHGRTTFKLSGDTLAALGAR